MRFPIRTRLLAMHGVSLLLAVMVAGCLSGPSPRADDPAWPGSDLLLLGEQHDAAEHQQLAARTIERLAQQGKLAAVALEMADRGRSTASLPRDASEAQIREALAWDDRGWPWAAYGPIVNAAVSSGVPVVGANLPRAESRPAMRDAGIDAQVDDAVRVLLQADVRDGHCNLLPASQLPAMTRVQIARDRSMAAALVEQARPGRVVLMVAGSNHVDATRGVPQHLATLAPALKTRTVRLAAGAAKGDASVGFDETWPTPAVTRGKDPCEGLAERLGPAR